MTNTTTTTETAPRFTCMGVHHLDTLITLMHKVERWTLMRAPGLERNPAGRDAIVETIFGDKLELACKIAGKCWALLHSGRYGWNDLRAEWPELHFALYDETKQDYRSLGAAHACAEWAGALRDALYRTEGRCTARAEVK